MSFTPKYLTLDELRVDGSKVIVYVNIEESKINNQLIFFYKYGSKSIGVKTQQRLTLECSKKLAKGIYDTKTIEKYLGFKLNKDSWKAALVEIECPSFSCGRIIKIDPNEAIFSCPCGKLFENEQ